jgi:MoaA/NifB/PqqE/SkfB family radical SAM enzyme
MYVTLYNILKYSKFTIIMSSLIKPKTLTIEANASCQLKCPTCPTTSKGYPPIVGSGYLKFDNFKTLIDNSPQTEKIYFSNRGEMFLNPELLLILGYGFKKNLPMYCTSGVNLNNVTEEVLEGLVKFGFKHLLCSIDGATAETYQKYRVGGNLNNVLKNIKTINKYKKKYNSEFPNLTWQFVVFGHNEHELPIAKRMADELNMGFVPKMSWDADYSPIRNKDFVKKETGWDSVTRNDFLKNTSKNYMSSVCYSLWHSPRINWDGKVLGCCWNSWKEFGGNAFEDGYITSINSENLNHARQVLLGNINTGCDIPCKTCEIYLQMKKSSNYLTMDETYPPLTLVNRAVAIFSRQPSLFKITRFLYRFSGLKYISNKLHY